MQINARGDILINNEELIKLIKDNIDIKQNYEKLYIQNKGFILKIIKNRVYGIYEIEDLLQSSFIALVSAVNLYDETKEYSSFLELLKYCIWNELRNTQRDLPAHIKSEIRKYKMTYNRLYEESGIIPSDKQIMLEMEIPIEKLYKIKHALQSNISIDESIKEDSNITIKDTLIDETAHEIAQEELEKEDLKRIVDEALKKLPDDEQTLIDYKYYKNMSLDKISYKMEITKGKARYIEEAAISKLRNNQKFKKKVFDYTSLDEYKKVGISEFNRTWISSTEWVVIKREELRKRF